MKREATRQQRYLEKLGEGFSIPMAMAAAEVKVPELADWREALTFRTNEAEIIGSEQPMGDHLRKSIYLQTLIEYRGNSSAARDLAGLLKRDVSEFKKTDKDFAEREEAIYEAIGDRIEQTAIEGAEHGKDLGHTMKVLGKLRKDKWGEETKRVDHRHSGSLVIRSLDEQLAELESDDGVDLLERPD